MRLFCGRATAHAGLVAVEWQRAAAEMVGEGATSNDVRARSEARTSEQGGREVGIPFRDASTVG